MCVCHRRCDYAHSKHCYRENLSRCVSLSPRKANEHGGHTSATTKNNVDGDRDVVAEGKVIEEIDSKEEDNVREPTSQGYSSSSEEERGI